MMKLQGSGQKLAGSYRDGIKGKERKERGGATGKKCH